MAPVEKVDEQQSQDDGVIGLIYPPPEVRSIFLLSLFIKRLLLHRNIAII